MVEVDTLDSFFEAFNSKDIDAILEFFHDDCVIYGPRGSDARGKKFSGKYEFEKAFSERNKVLPEYHYGDVRHWVVGDMAFSEWTLKGTLTNGENIEVRGTDHLEFKDGKVLVKDAWWKMIEK
jgi:ketosteroid isomerase-like protein